MTSVRGGLQEGCHLPSSLPSPQMHRTPPHPNPAAVVVQSRLVNTGKVLHYILTAPDSLRHAWQQRRPPALPPRVAPGDEHGMAAEAALGTNPLAALHCLAFVCILPAS